MVLNLKVIKFSEAEGTMEVVNSHNTSGNFIQVMKGTDYSDRGNWLGDSHSPLQIKFTGRMSAHQNYYTNVVLVTAWDSGDYQLKLRIGSRGDTMSIRVGGSRDVYLTFHYDGRLTISSPEGFMTQGDDVVLYNIANLI